MARSTTSVRLADDLRQHLAAAAGDEGTTVTDLIERYVREGLASAEHPGIVFKPGPSGRRAALAGGPDVWEILSALRHTHGTEHQKVAALATEFGLHERQIGIAAARRASRSMTSARRAIRAAATPPCMLFPPMLLGEPPPVPAPVVLPGPAGCPGSAEFGDSGVPPPPAVPAPLERRLVCVPMIRCH